MRIASDMYYKNIYGTNNSQLSKSLFDVNKQIASGLKIQYAQDDIRTFTETMRLDNEIATLQQSKKSSENGYKISNQTDTVLNDFTLSLDRFKTLLVQSANATQNDTSLDAIAKELRSLEKHFKNIANSSINGQFLFSGSAVDVKPIAEDGTYMGNDTALKSFGGSNITQQYNITGSELFLGEENSRTREITSNVANYSLSAKYPQIDDKVGVDGIDEPITEASTIRDLMGDTDAEIDTINAKHHFYVRGTTSGAESFNKQISMRDDESVDALLTKIGEAYGNTPDMQVVNVSLNSYGEIVIEDKMKGSSKLDFHMVGATDFGYSGFASIDRADVSNAAVYSISELGKIENLLAGETNFSKIINNTSSSAYENVYVKNFVKSDFEPSNTLDAITTSAVFSLSGAATADIALGIGYSDSSVHSYLESFTTDAFTTYANLKNSIEADGNFEVSIAGDEITLTTTPQGVAKGAYVSSNLSTTGITVTTNITKSSIESELSNLFYDNTYFTKDGAKLTSNVSQITKETNAFATTSTKLSEVASGSSLHGTSMLLEGKNISGNNYNIKIDFATAGSTFSLDTNADGVYDDGTYSIFDVGSPRAAVSADDMTYKQLMDVMNMAVTGNLPVTNDAASYDTAVQDADLRGRTFLTHDGKIAFEEMGVTSTKATVALYDANSGDFFSSSASSMVFNANNALSVRDPKTDFFKTIDEAIKAVEEAKVHPDSSNGDPRNLGIQNAIETIDNLSDHVYKIHSKAGSQSNALDASMERSEMLEISSMMLRSSVIDTDLAEASLTLTQLKLNYEAMLSTVGKISQLSLVNYL